MAGLLGWPVSHSLSPRLYAYWRQVHGIDGHYVPLAVRPDHLEQAVRALPVLGFRGVNVTVPHKEAVVPLMGRLHPTAQAIGAVNLIAIDAKGRFEGRNTDAEGFIAHLRQSVPGWKATGSAALILGAGGAARAVCVALLEAGIDRLIIANRHTDRAERLARALDQPRISVAGWADRFSVSRDIGLLVNTTSLGMTGQPGLDMNLSLMPTDAVVYDIVYAPLKTELLAQAERRGLQAVDGLGMLLHQGVSSFELYTGIRPRVDDSLIEHMKAALSKAPARTTAAEGP